MQHSVLKRCRTCKKEKPTSEYWKDRKLSDGLQKDCIECSKLNWRKRVTPEKREQYRERSQKFDDLNIQRYLLRIARKRAKAKGIPCTIRAADIYLPERCPVLDVPLVKNKGQWSDNSYSLDRVDSTKGYVTGNVRVISWKANSIKGALSIEQVERMLKYMKGEI